MGAFPRRVSRECGENPLGQECDPGIDTHGSVAARQGQGRGGLFASTFRGVPADRVKVIWRFAHGYVHDGKQTVDCRPQYPPDRDAAAPGHHVVVGGSPPAAGPEASQGRQPLPGFLRRPAG